MSTAEAGDSAWCPADPTKADCPGCGALDGMQFQPAPPKVEAWSCAACSLHWCTTVVNPTLRIALSIVVLVPTPQLRTAALLDVMRAEVTQRAQAREHTMAVSVCFPLDQVVQFDAMATVDTTLAVPDLRAGRHRENNTAGDRRRRCASGH